MAGCSSNSRILLIFLLNQLPRKGWFCNNCVYCVAQHQTTEGQWCVTAWQESVLLHITGRILKLASGTGLSTCDICYSNPVMYRSLARYVSQCELVEKKRFNFLGIHRLKRRKPSTRKQIISTHPEAPVQLGIQNQMYGQQFILIFSKGRYKNPLNNSPVSNDIHGTVKWWYAVMGK